MMVVVMIRMRTLYMTPPSLSSLPLPLVLSLPSPSFNPLHFTHPLLAIPLRYPFSDDGLCDDSYDDFIYQGPTFTPPLLPFPSSLSVSTLCPTILSILSYSLFCWWSLCWVPLMASYIRHPLYFPLLPLPCFYFFSPSFTSSSAIPFTLPPSSSDRGRRDGPYDDLIHNTPSVSLSPPQPSSLTLSIPFPTVLSFLPSFSVDDRNNESTPYPTSFL